MDDERLQDAILFRLQTYARRARSKGLQFDLTAEQFKTLLYSDCHYCGLPAAMGAQTGMRDMHGKSRSNGIDRVDNLLGYTAGNAVPCCISCNNLKADNPLAGFVAYIRRAYEGTKHIQIPEVDPREFIDRGYVRNIGRSKRERQK